MIHYTICTESSRRRQTKNVEKGGERAREVAALRAQKIGINSRSLTHGELRTAQEADGAKERRSAVACRSATFYGSS